jgi:superfamily II DNA helicase RecQ
VLHDTTMRELAAVQPRTRTDLARIKGLGPVKVERYGDDLLAVIGAS